MAFLARRRLQAMLDDVSRLIPKEKTNDLLARLENKKVDQALPAEMELAMLWAFQKLGDMDVEPEWWGDSRRPDIVTEHFIPGVLTAVEIAAATDNSISGEEVMRRIALQFVNHANTLKKNLGNYLYFTFESEFVKQDGMKVRRRMAPEDHIVSEDSKHVLVEWLKSGQSNSTRLHVREKDLSVFVEQKPFKVPDFHNVFCSIPPETHDAEDNPLHELLKRKSQQLKAAVNGTLRIILVADVGSTLLRHISSYRERFNRGNTVSGTDIIQSFLKKNSDRIDAVIVFTAQRESQPLRRDSLSWCGHAFSNNSELKSEIKNRFNNIISLLPSPVIEGYQARSLHLQGAFSPKARGHYLGVNMTSKMDSIRLSISSRLLLDLLAGRIKPDQLPFFMGDRPGEIGLIKRLLDNGKTLSHIEMAPRNLDEDDDYLVLSFTDDPAARPLNLSSSVSNAE